MEKKEYKKVSAVESINEAIFWAKERGDNEEVKRLFDLLQKIVETMAIDL